MTRRPRMSRPVSLALGALLAIAPAACMEVLDDRENSAGDGCGGCHSADGNSARHATHVLGEGAYGKEFACEECHPVPSELFAEGHVDAKVDVVFPEGGLARADGAEPTYLGYGRCEGVYCHGATLGGGNSPFPEGWGWGWFDSSLSEIFGDDIISCGACHSIPPPSPHPSDDECKSCHEDAYDDHALDPAFHINGEVDFEDEGEDDGVGARP